MTIRFEPNLQSEGASIYAHELDAFFDRFTDNYDVLSLDCFDTLLWRNVGQPKDVFFDIEALPLSRKLALTAKVRSQAEKAVREERVIRGRSSEVTLHDIYRKAVPTADAALLDQLVQNELKIELERCYIYEPSLALLRKAKQKGLKTMVVSDIYMSSAQLRELIIGALNKIDADCPIDYFFSSSDRGMSKADGLIGQVAKEIKVKTNRIIHLGDNEEADAKGAIGSGATGILLRQYSNELQEITRSVRYAATLLDTDIRSRKPYADSWSGLWAQSKTSNDAMHILSRYSLGPIMLNYTYWLVDQLREIKKDGLRPKLVFMLRDGYMPARIFEATKPYFPDLSDLPISEVETSRFIAYACSFSSQDRIIEYLQFLCESSQPVISMALKQLLFTREEIARISVQFKQNEADFKRFINAITKAPYASQIIERSAKYRERFLKRFKQVVDPHPGDVIVLADLGYAGTIQTLIQPIIEQEFSVSVCGKYLLLQDTLNKDHKSALIDERDTDMRSIGVLLKHIALLEQLCSNNMASTIDFTDDGDPIYSDQMISLSQRERRDAIQRLTQSFVDRAAYNFIKSHPVDIKSQTLGLLGRMLMFPTWTEVEFFSQLVHDTNFGTDYRETLVDLPRIHEELIRNGSLAINRNQRNAIPHELKAISIENLIFYNAATRFGLDFRADDFHVQGEKFPVGIMTDRDAAKYNVMPYNTAYGYKTLVVPITPTTNSVCLLFGQDYEWIDIEGCFVSAGTKSLFHSNEKIEFPRTHIMLDGMSEKSPGLYEVQSAGAFALFVIKDIIQVGKSAFLSVTFRPIRQRSKHQ